MKTTSKKVTRLTTLAMLLAIELAMRALGLGAVPVGPLNMSFLTLPIAMAAILCGPLEGLVLGAVFGLLSLYDAVSGRSAMTGAFFAVSPLVHKLLHGSDGLVGTTGHKILDLHIANGAIDQIAFRDLRIHLVPGDIEGHRLPLTHNGNGHMGTRFSLDALRQVGHGELLHALPVHLNDHILRLHAGLLRGAALHHGLDHKAAGLWV